jgi:Delta24(24(1))-sterol reductase
LVDKKLDEEIVYEFGGPVGVTFMMLFFPALMYYFWTCLKFYNGALQYPRSVSEVKPFFEIMLNHVIHGAYPTQYAVVVYVGFTLFQALLSVIMPGVWVKGLPVPSENNKQLDYLCNGVSAWYVTLAVSLSAHYYGYFDLTSIVDNFGPLLTVSIIFGNVVTWLTYLITVFAGKPHRMSGNFFYDLFMGAPLNPRIGYFDLKMYAEIRVPWKILFFVSLSAMLKQYRELGHFTPELVFMTLAHFLYVNACMKVGFCYFLNDLG